MQGAKVWKRKLHYKRSLRPMRTAERLMKNLHKETDDEEADEIEKRRQKGKKEQKEVSDTQKTEVKEISHTCPVSSKIEQKGKRKGNTWKA